MDVAVVVMSIYDGLYRLPVEYIVQTVVECFFDNLSCYSALSGVDDY